MQFIFARTLQYTQRNYSIIFNEDNLKQQKSNQHVISIKENQQKSQQKSHNCNRFESSIRIRNSQRNKINTAM